MTELELLRVCSLSDGQLGVLRNKEVPLCLTLELPYKDNEKNVSSIPVGIYRGVRTTNRQTSGGMKLKTTYEVCPVVGRSGILFHPGNTIKDTKGCILVGLGFERPGATLTLTHSLDAFSRLLELLRGVSTFTLKISTL